MNISLAISGSVCGISLNGGIQESADGAISFEWELPAAINGIVENGGAQTIRFPSGHVPLAGNCDLYWETAAGSFSRYRLLIASTADPDVYSFMPNGWTSSNGDAFPATGTAVVAAMTADVVADVDPTRFVYGAMICDRRATCLWELDDADTGTSGIAAIRRLRPTRPELLQPGDIPAAWSRVRVSCGDDRGGLLKMGLLHHSL